MRKDLKIVPAVFPMPVLMIATYNEDGNERYEYFFPMEDKETVMLIDRWKNQEALDIHHKSEMMKQITELRNKYELKMKIERYTEIK